MKIHVLERTTLLKGDPSAIWDFFSSPANLDRITPPDMSFEILSDIQGKKMYPGMIICYKVSPFKGVRMRWTTEITQCEEGRYFVDEQRFGPYALWHHEHHFEQVDGGVKMTDIIHYAIGWGWLGEWMHALVVRKRLQSIFDHRTVVIGELF